MNKLLVIALPIVLLLAAFPLGVAVVLGGATQAMAECDPASTGTGPGVDDAGGDFAQVSAPTVDAAGTPGAAGGDVTSALRRLRFSEDQAPMSDEQARNAVAIAQVARRLQVPQRGLQVAIATAIQESQLRNLDHGDRDSLGLFQQRPSTGWGSAAQVTDPTAAAEAFFGRATHTNNPGLLDVPGWQQMPVTVAAQAVQRSGFPDAYARWEAVAADITDLLGGDLPRHTTTSTVSGDGTSAGSGAGTDGLAGAACPTAQVGADSVTVATLNLLGADHTSRGGKYPGFGGWEGRLAGAMGAIEAAGVSIAALQEVHPPQGDALEGRYSARWGIYPASGGSQNRVVWDRNLWQATERRMVPIPYFHGEETPMPLVKLTSTNTQPAASQSIWVWSIHNPASTRGPAKTHRAEALRRQHTTLSGLAGAGTPVVIAGDFNDAGDGPNRSHCRLTPLMTNAFGGSATPCRAPKAAAPIDHVYGANLTWADARVDHSTQRRKISDHPLVIATTASSSNGCAIGPADSTSNGTGTSDVSGGGSGERAYDLGRVKPQLSKLVDVLAPMFDITTVGGYRASARDPGGHPSGLAADFMVPITAAGRAQGDALARYARQHAERLGVDYIIWYQKIWSTSRASEGWRSMSDRGGATANHVDHVHINVKPTGATGAAIPIGANGTGGGSGTAGASAAEVCSEVVYPVPGTYVANDSKNWRNQGSSWGSWHTGTDFGAPCGTPVYAAHAGTIEVDTTQGWAGPTLVKVNRGPGQLSTWYAHMQRTTVSRGEQVQPGQQIGEVGNEGNSKGCHLHFEVHLKGGSIYGPDNTDPSNWLQQNSSRPRRAL